MSRRPKVRQAAAPPLAAPPVTREDENVQLAFESEQGRILRKKGRSSTSIVAPPVSSALSGINQGGTRTTAGG